jgi:glutamyl-tRNA synthetase
MLFEAVINSKKEDPLYASILAAKFAGFDISKSVNFKADENSLSVGGERYTDDAAIAEYIARTCLSLLGSNAIEHAQIYEYLLPFRQYYKGTKSLEQILELVKAQLTKQHFLVFDHPTVADLVFFGILIKHQDLQTVPPYSKFFNFFKNLPQVADVHRAIGIIQVPASSSKAPAANTKSKEPKAPTRDEGKFVELPGAVKGEVIVRFPPEASGYLHIGHAKAALLNAYYQKEFEGKLVMRFDDTNPAKENALFEDVIKGDLELLGIKPDIWTHSSDHFDVLIEMCEKLLKEGKAFVDDTDMETMRKEREERADSKNRNNSPEKNLELWAEMKKGSARGQECCVRIKIDMKHNNGALRDPTIYRCKNEPHVRTGDKYKVYPTYDFACPIVDSREGITHALRTTEYHDRDDQYYFICDALGLRKPYIWEYARLNMTHTVMSKRKLTLLVDEGIVEGWDDPRLPTVRGIIRRGLTVEGLKQFILAQGGSRSIVVMEWDKLWAFNKKVIDPIAPRYTALEGKLVTVNLNGAKSETGKVNLHPKDASIGAKDVHYGPKVLLEQVDADLMNEGDIVTFVNWGNVKLTKVEKKDGHTISINAELDLENKDFKKTMKVTWLVEPSVEIQAVRYDPVISKAIIGKEEEWKNYVNKDSKHVFSFKAEEAIKNVKKGEIIQIQRKQYYICDKIAENGKPAVFIEIPDGHVKGANDEKKPEKPTKSSKKETTPKPSGSGGPTAAEIDAQGVLVRDLKAKDAKSQETKDAIAKLLELKKQYKEATGQEYKPGAAPPPQSSTPAAASAGSDETALYAAVEAQGNAVRDAKTKDAKSQETKDAVAKLLDLKKQYKEKTGKEYKPGAASATPSAPKSTGGGDEAALYAAVEAQGNVVRDAKTKDAKSQETKDAIAKLLELKKEYKAKTGKEYKPGAAPTQSSPPAADSSNNEEESLYAAVEAHGNLVRDAKTKDAKSQETKDAIAKLLELKKEYKAKTGKEYKPK